METNDKRKLIEDIKGEVSNFHPILENILPKLANIEGYEYTQGQFERGADFILKHKNTTTGRSKFIGIVVKVGKISSSTVPIIEEQINECAEERFYKVMNRVSCSEVWVIASGGYSERAKEKLKHRIIGKSIDFFGSEDIVEWIDRYYPFYWHQLPNKLGEYIENLEKRLSNIEKSSSLNNCVTLDSDLYIELDTFEKVQKSYLKTNTKIEKKNVEIFKCVIESKISLLEAEMGYGKSKLSRKIAHNLCNPQSVKEKKIIPIYSSFREFYEKQNLDLDLLINEKLGDAKEIIIQDKLEILIILDGIDECSTLEKPTSEIYDIVVNQCKKLDYCRLLITTRPLKAINDKATLYSDARVFCIRPLSLAKIVNYLKIACSKSRLPSRLFEDLKRSQLFKQLPHSPIAAALFSNLLNENQQDVPQNLTELYSKSLELMLGRWDLKKELATEKEYKTAQIIAENIADFFVQNKLIYVSYNEIRELVSSYLSKRNTGVSTETIEEILFNRSNIFNNETEGGIISFRHRSFAEFLYAQKKSRDQSLPIIESALNPYWSNIFFFYSGILLDCPEALDQVRNYFPKEEAEKWMKIIAVPSYLMAAYQTEFDILERSLNDVLLVAANLFIQIKSGNTSTKLKDLPEMHLLYLFKALLSENISYDFFYKGFNNICLELDSHEIQEEKFLALFFLACAESDLGRDDTFNYLLETYGVTDLPISISLAITSEVESKNNINKNRNIKKHITKLRKMLYPNHNKSHNSQASKNKIDDLYKKPLSLRMNVTK